MITGKSGTNKSEWFEKCKPFFNCFCFFTNGQKILYVGSSEGQLPCLHGIRFLSMSWIILCHSYAFSASSIRNMAETINLFDNWPFQVILNGFYSVDSFFFCSADFLVTHVYLQQAFKTDGKIPWLYFYIHRFIRLTPVYMIVLAFYTTLDSHISSGPIWPDVDVDPSCQSRWWWNILYINNFLTASEQCMGWAWYLANDMQFYVICPLFLIALWRRPVIGYSLLGVTFAASTITTFVLSYEYNLFSGLGNIVRVVDDIEDFMLRWTDYFDIIYIKPYTRISPYLVGILLAYCIYKTRQNGSFKLHKITLYLGWIVASTITLACMYGLYHRDQSRVEIAFYNSFSRTCFFAFGLAWVIFVCVTDQGGDIFSWIPICIYLMQLHW
ncbi:nose resistant to fluoxetine protein 6 [Caerostris extrusa]|uniref:Nose resistant to fluoxetine protein 6 n=1 Tax=Caerostris extrusa TaxID=172846 RepID=A0AAV4WHE6_CAEEX|nr:nose resistant to fluoxetine protein 6 [Caerostris extrusa]